MAATTTVPTATATRLQAAYLTPATPSDLYNKNNPIDHCSICLLAFPSTTTTTSPFSSSSSSSFPSEEKDDNNDDIDDDTTTTASPPAKLHPCNHIFCRACITRHLHADGRYWCPPRPRCPMCRALPVASEAAGGERGGVDPVVDDDDVCVEDMLEVVINRMVRREIERVLGGMALAVDGGEEGEEEGDRMDVDGLRGEEGWAIALEEGIAAAMEEGEEGGEEEGDRMDVDGLRGERGWEIELEERIAAALEEVE